MTPTDARPKTNISAARSGATRVGGSQARKTPTATAPASAPSHARTTTTTTTGGTDAPTNVDGLIRQTRQPQFISSSYFLRFKFDEGTYALVGREKFEGRDVLRVEYYPTKLFSDDRRGRGAAATNRAPPTNRPRSADPSCDG